MKLLTFKKEVFPLSVKNFFFVVLNLFIDYLKEVNIMVKIAPSLLNAPKTNLKNTIQELESAGADMFHIDIMDGHFVDQIAFGKDLVNDISNITTLPLDLHLMVTNPNKIIPEYIFKKVDTIGIHIESTNHIHREITLIHELGKHVSVVLNPGTPVSLIQSILPLVEKIMIMTVDPGFGGSNFEPLAVKKIKELADIRKETHLNYQIQVDGSINNKNIQECINNGLDIAVSGSYIFNYGNYRDAIMNLKNTK